ncbi:MAG: peroxide stress protein YaaA [Eubacteriales bacterium]|nr:peroxide stress protein YaaA [Eubacteriales bacterium]
MRIILSPAKKMNTDTESLKIQGMPVFLSQTEDILKWMQSKSLGELQKLWKCNDRIAEQNVERLEHMDLRSGLTPALCSYEGIAYQYMAPTVFEDGQIDYVQEHLRILSAFYGVVKPLDGVTPYRLEMQAKASISGHKDLYELWGSRLYEEIRDGSGVIINLASKEYSKCIEKYLTDRDTYITCTFGEMSGDKFVTKGTYAKMARGEMVRFMAENQIENPEEIRQFDRLGYAFRDDLSNDTEYVFERQAHSNIFSEKGLLEIGQ